MQDYQNMKEAMDLFALYPDSEASIAFVNGLMLAGPHPEIVSTEDRKKLLSLGWLVSSAYECFEFWKSRKAEPVYIDPLIKTNILCFSCKKEYGLDCGVREPNESTLCRECFELHMKENRKQQREYLEQFFNDPDISIKELRVLQESFLENRD